MCELGTGFEGMQNILILILIGMVPWVMVPSDVQYLSPFFKYFPFVHKDQNFLATYIKNVSSLQDNFLTKY